MRTIITIVKADYCFMSQLLLNILSNVTLPPYPSFFVHFKHTFVTHPTKISHFSITVMPPPRDMACQPPKILNVHMAIGVLVEALLPGGGGAVASGGGGEPPPKDEKGLKEWIRNKLKALASLSGQLGIKAAEALPGIIGGIISWILNRAKDVVGWVSQNLWALVVGIGGLIYT